MTTNLLCYFCNDLTDPERGYVPIGVVARDEHDVAFKIINDQDLPPENQPQSKFIRSMFYDGTLERIFRATREPTRGQPLTLHFVEIESDLDSGSLPDKVNVLFEQHVTTYYQRRDDEKKEE